MSILTPSGRALVALGIIGAAVFGLALANCEPAEEPFPPEPETLTPVLPDTGFDFSGTDEEYALHLQLMSDEDFSHCFTAEPAQSEEWLTDCIMAEKEIIAGELE